MTLQLFTPPPPRPTVELFYHGFRLGRLERIDVDEYERFVRLEDPVKPFGRGFLWVSISCRDRTDEEILAHHQSIIDRP